MFPPEPVNPRDDGLRATAGGGFFGVTFGLNQFGDFSGGHRFHFQIPADALAENRRGGDGLK